MQKTMHFSRLLVVLFLVAGLFSCERLGELYRLTNAKGTKVEKEHNNKGKDMPGDPCGEPLVIRLLSKDNLDYSPCHVVVTNDDQFLSVKFEVVEGDWNIDMMYLQVGPLDDVPLDETGSYPAFWDFDYQYQDIPVATHTFQIPLTDLDDCFMILVQARVIDPEGNVMILWSEGINPDWTAGPFYTKYCVEICIGTTTGTHPVNKPDNPEVSKYDWDDDWDDDGDD
jgi:hypothetical protein